MTKLTDNEITTELNHELVVNIKIMKHLFSLVKQKTVQHKIIEVNNLFNEELYHYIVQNHFEENFKENKYINGKISEITDIAEITNGTTTIVKNRNKNNNINEMEDVLSHSLLQNEAQIKRYNVFDKFTNWENLRISEELSEAFDIYYKEKIQNQMLETGKQKFKILFLSYNNYKHYDNNCKLCSYNINKYNEDLKMKNSINEKSNYYFDDYFFVLGSTSTSRKHIMENSNIHFLTIPIKIEETKIGSRKNNDPLTLTSNISIGKGMKLLNIIKQNKELTRNIAEKGKGKKILLLVGDEVIYCNNTIYEKPKDITEAICFLKTYSNNKCYSYCSLSVMDLETEKFITGIDETIINVSEYDIDSINNILKDPSVFWCSGALKIENEEMSKYIQSIQGSVDSIFGLSINLLSHLVNLI